jgi:alanine racemase
VKANAYGIGAENVVARLVAEGCTDFFVATWAEAAELGPFQDEARVAVLHGAQASDMKRVAAINAKPVLCSPEQVVRWRETAGRPCDVMIDTGMNRLGLSVGEAASGLLDGLNVETLHSHLACADEPDHPMNFAQLVQFRQAAECVAHQRLALANSAGICLGMDYAFELARPGIGLYGGVPHLLAKDALRPVVNMQAKVLQVRDVPIGASVGYNASFVARRRTRVAILNLGYADGLPRSIAKVAHARVDGADCEILGRISMDLTAIDVSARSATREGDWIGIAFDLAAAANACDRSQYELLTGLGRRFDRVALRN